MLHDSVLLNSRLARLTVRVGICPGALDDLYVYGEIWLKSTRF